MAGSLLSTTNEEWARLHDLRESEMAWYVPGEKAKGLVKSLLEKFVFPIVDSLRDAKMDRFRNLSFIIISTNVHRTAAYKRDRRIRSLLV
ncbi:hypothetical protein ANCDUO_00837 [Ancylostoma duodenale]|uniref:Uncharacterized protein n=1 Tax=Ancylostoma duodenale TaxID=51022 RepID=A0A0C2DFR9_9BILA|nr:hypothetical protein ANCDUO_00837 [Ancylostoma duodenale]